MSLYVDGYEFGTKVAKKQLSSKSEVEVQGKDVY